MTKVVLGGGLGNQFFQYAAGLKVAQEGQLLLDNSFGLARKALGRQVDLDHFVLARNAQFLKSSRRSYLSRKLVNLSFRESAKENSKLLLSVEIFMTFVSRCSGNINFRWFVNSGIGWDSRIEGVGSASTLVGYFQSYAIFNDSRIREELLNIKLHIYSQNLSQKIIEAKSQKPIFVHIRLSDYILESMFGVPSTNYYAEALAALDNRDDSDQKIWLFSDSPVEAINMIPAKYQSRVVMYQDDGLSAAESLELMRYGDAYVIANSTFSWWAAYLRNNQSATVIAPDPWFSGMSDPVGLCPTDWLRLPSN